MFLSQNRKSEIFDLTAHNSGKQKNVFWGEWREEETYRTKYVKIYKRTLTDRQTGQTEVDKVDGWKNGQADKKQIVKQWSWSKLSEKLSSMF
jgi:serine/threonine-protein kinase RIO1